MSPELAGTRLPSMLTVVLPTASSTSVVRLRSGLMVTVRRSSAS